MIKLAKRKYICKVKHTVTALYLFGPCSAGAFLADSSQCLLRALFYSHNTWRWDKSRQAASGWTDGWMEARQKQRISSVPVLLSAQLPW